MTFHRIFHFLRKKHVLTQLFYGIVAEANKNKCISQYLPSKKHSKCPKFGKIRGENPQMCPFTELSSSFLVIPHHL